VTATITAPKPPPPNPGDSKAALVGAAAVGVGTSEIGVGEILIGVGVVAGVDAVRSLLNKKGSNVMDARTKNPSGNPDRNVGQDKPPAGSKGIDETAWSGDHQERAWVGRQLAGRISDLRIELGLEVFPSFK
jgi:hypothetical protein